MYIPGQVADLNIALVLIFAIGSIGVYGFILGGWSSDSKYALLGSMRTCAQLVSYEVALALSVLGVVLMAGTLSLTGIVAAQADSLWYAVPQFVGLLVFLLAGQPRRRARRSTSRRPSRSSSPATTRSTAACASGSTDVRVHQPDHALRPLRDDLPRRLARAGLDGPSWAGPLWFLLKLIILLFVFIWMRTTLPRLRYDQLMRFGWKILLPVATINAVVTAILVVAL